MREKETKITNKEEEVILTYIGPIYVIKININFHLHYDNKVNYLNSL